ncbi:alpha-1,3/1,6-mannosyltransferase ALG2-like [Tubulanus polymorphus]|uniref:alpha-1,3/1,6-mannosyltransferase ALG2-like n=1 Tax=Tubulanus polymorphus TaxID=672921 RepID=UPI003DA1EEBE
MANSTKKIVFLHPDLGIGGAERAVIDAALALKSRGHSVQFITAHHDPGHCFEETRDGTLKVTSAGDWLPRSIFGKCYALCAYLRMIYAALYLVLFSGLDFDVIYCDQISACIPVLKLSTAKILFYCHFPDMLLTQRKSRLKQLYRFPIDWMEEKTTGMADLVLVNSLFTAGVFKETFTSLTHIRPGVLYPIPNFSTLDQAIPAPTSDLIPEDKRIIFLSINRYERKKNIALAVRALAQVKSLNGTLDGIHLVIAGGYDERVRENKEYHLELEKLAAELDLNSHISFVRSFSDIQKRTLLHHSTCLLYTPDKEHFGIVPIESMYMKCPVIAVNSGGPKETVVDELTGYLCESKPDSFADAMLKIIINQSIAKDMGDAARKHVLDKFSFEAFTEHINAIISELGEPSLNKKKD